MIDAVEELYAEEEIAADEAFRWEELKESLRQLINQLNDSRIDSIRQTGNKLTPEYNKLESELGKLQDYVDGRIEELTPGSYRQDMKLHHYARGRRLEALDYALQEGINAVALSRIYSVDRQLDAIDYIRERGLASLNYEATCRAVNEYEAQRGVLGWA